MPDSKTEDGQRDRLRLWNRILDEQFELSYYVKGITFQDTDNMSTFERKEMYNRLLRKKEAETKAAEEAAKSRKSSRSRRPARRGRAR